MPTPGPWIQPDPLWVARPVDLSIVTWRRYAAWLWSDHGNDPAFYDTMFAAMMDDDAATWTARLTGDSWQFAQATETLLNDDATFAPASQSGVGTSATPGSSANMSVDFAFAELTADMSTDGGPLIGPDEVPDGAVVEYEADNGTFGASLRYTVQTSTTAVDRARFAHTVGGGYQSVAASPSAGAPWRSWTIVDQTSTPQSHQIETSASSITLSPIFRDWVTGSWEWMNAVASLNRMFFDGGSVPPTLERWYTPPRYRIIPPATALWHLAQVQHEAGNNGGWPLAVVQNGGHTGGWRKSVM